MVTIPTTEDTRADDLKSKSRISDPTISLCENREPRGKSIRIVTVKKRGKRSIDRLFIIKLVFNKPLFKFLLAIIVETIAKAGTIAQKGKWIPINIKIGKSKTKPN